MKLNLSVKCQDMKNEILHGNQSIITDHKGQKEE